MNQIAHCRCKLSRIWTPIRLHTARSYATTSSCTTTHISHPDDASWRDGHRWYSWKPFALDDLRNGIHVQTMLMHENGIPCERWVELFVPRLNANSLMWPSWHYVMTRNQGCLRHSYSSPLRWRMSACMSVGLSPDPHMPTWSFLPHLEQRLEPARSLPHHLVISTMASPAHATSSSPRQPWRTRQPAPSTHSLTTNS